MQQSLWQATSTLPSFPPLQKNCKTDVLIIGGGMAGILTAYFLQQRGIQTILVEQNRIGAGITGNTTAKITAQHGFIYHKLANARGIRAAKDYWEANQWAVREYARICQSIDCDFEVKNNYVYTLDDPRLLHKELTALAKMGADAGFSKVSGLPFNTAGGVVFPRQAQFHPLKFLADIAKDLPIYEHTKVLEMIGNTAVTTGGKVQAGRVIVTTHFPFLNKHGSYFLKLYQHRSYVIALKNAPDVKGMYVDDCQTGFSFRNYGDLLLIGGGAHRTGKKGGSFAEIRAFAKKYFPHAREVHHWATQDCMSLDGIPYIGQYAKTTPHLYTATGFNKWGMTGAMVSAKVLSDLVTEKSGELTRLFDPSRSMLTPQLAVNSLEATVSLLTPTPKRCPHLGCALKWNPAEHTWDCPCHGSRFSREGKVLNNPATDDLKGK